MNIWDQTEIEVALSIAKRFKNEKHQMPIVLVSGSPVALNIIKESLFELLGPRGGSKTEWAQGRAHNMKIYDVYSKREMRKLKITESAQVMLSNSVHIDLNGLAKAALRQRTGLRVGLLGGPIANQTKN